MGIYRLYTTSNARNTNCKSISSKHSINDGSLQLTVQSLSTMIRQNLNPVIFVINNDGYTVERMIHGMKEPYNDIRMWDYKSLPSVFGTMF